MRDAEDIMVELFSSFVVSRIANNETLRCESLRFSRGAMWAVFLTLVLI